MKIRRNLNAQAAGRSRREKLRATGLQLEALLEKANRGSCGGPRVAGGWEGGGVGEQRICRAVRLLCIGYDGGYGSSYLCPNPWGVQHKRGL